ncbi:hypothetical protein [Burkholderia gladioli]|uniref:hypothetical protein n=1 Tax=Burkholderia gladioli TaxID=28095 RepID=UPI00163FF3E6|nr:hypothetical protein [Burkholderia gladioli]
MNTSLIPFEAFRTHLRDAILVALDDAMRELTGCETALGSRDADLPHLFAAIDEHAIRLAHRFNDPESEEVGSAYLSIRLDAEEVA